MLVSMNYKGYCTKVYTNDTIVVIKYKGHFGLFLDSSASVRLTKKVILADTLAKINSMQETIISRNELLRTNAITIENSFKQYQSNSDKEKELLIKQYNKKLFNKNLQIWGYRIGIGGYFIIQYIVPLFKP